MFVPTTRPSADVAIPTNFGVKAPAPMSVLVVKLIPVLIKENPWIDIFGTN